ncbi:MAG: hypothetical protein KGS28_16725 [Betaproteobacteria bacterium]|nr:hypothetical protein [Betaproteobacteria bacterium]
MNSKTNIGPQARSHRSARTNDVHPINATTDAVRLQDGRIALVDRTDRLALEAQGVRGHWFLNLSGKGVPYVRVEGAQNLATVSRLIMCAGPDEQVCHLNRNRLDLRRANLELQPRRGGKRCNIAEIAADLFPGSPESQAAYIRLFCVSKAGRDRRDREREASEAREKFQRHMEARRRQGGHGRPWPAGAVGGAQ